VHFPGAGRTLQRDVAPMVVFSLPHHDMAGGWRGGGTQRVETGKMDVCAMGNTSTVPGYSKSLTVTGLYTSPGSPRSNGLRHVDFAFIERRSSPFVEILAFVVFEVALQCVLAWRRHFRT
jgi:hypothetical protein